MAISSAPSRIERIFFQAGLYTARSLYHEAFGRKCTGSYSQ